MEDIIYLLYTHTEYDDIFEIHIKKLVEFLPFINYAICIDNAEYFFRKYGSIYKPVKVYQYDTNAPYSERIRSVISQINTQYLILGHDTNILVSPVNEDIFKQICNITVNNNIDQLRLLVSGIPHPVFNEQNIHKITEGYFMSVASAIWKTQSLLDIVSKYTNLSYREFESGPIQNETKKLNNYYISTLNDLLFKKEGLSLSFIFPVIHVTFRGKWWYTNNHKPFIDRFIKEFDIDINKRGAYYDRDFADEV